MQEITKEVPNQTLGVLTCKVVASLQQAKVEVLQLVQERSRQKLSATQIANVAREIGDLIKIIKTFRC